MGNKLLKHILHDLKIKYGKREWAEPGHSCSKKCPDPCPDRDDAVRPARVHIMSKKDSKTHTQGNYLTVFPDFEENLIADKGTGELVYQTHNPKLEKFLKFTMEPRPFHPSVWEFLCKTEKSRNDFIAEIKNQAPMDDTSPYPDLNEVSGDLILKRLEDLKIVFQNIKLSTSFEKICPYNIDPTDSSPEKKKVDSLNGSSH